MGWRRSIWTRRLSFAADCNKAPGRETDAAKPAQIDWLPSCATKKEEIMSSIVDKINKTVYKDYPVYKGVKPKVSENSKGELLLVYEKSEKTEDGLSFPMMLRVKTDSDGNIKSVSGSR